MLQYFVILVLFGTATSDPETNNKGITVSNEQFPAPKEPGLDSNVENMIQNIETIADSADKAKRNGIIPEDQVNELYDAIVNKLDDIIDSLKDTHNAYRFYSVKGIERVIFPNINSDNKFINKKVLLLIKILFNVIPITSKDVMPINIIDKLLDVFENGDVDSKVISLDILYVWLPNQPKLQARVMKVKGLEVFYNQIGKLDDLNRNKMVDLFNIILQEHLNVRTQETTDDFENYKIYEFVGLIERMSTPLVCNGLLNLIEFTLFTDKGIAVPVFKLVKNIEEFCLNIYKNKPKAIKLFSDIHQYMSEGNVTWLDLGLNVTEEQVHMENYLEKLKKNVKSEL